MRIELGDIIRAFSLQIKPPPPPVLDRRVEFHIKVRNILQDLKTESASGTQGTTLFIRNTRLSVRFHSKQSLPQIPVWVNSQKKLAKNDETRNMLDIVWRKIVDLDSVHIKKCTEQWMKGE